MNYLRASVICIIMKNKILILGGNGFLGCHLQEFLFNNYSETFEVVVVDNKEMDNSHFLQIKRDLSLGNNLEDLVLKENPNYIINLVGLIQPVDVRLFVKINAFFPLELLAIFEKHNNLKIKKILLVGSAAEYGANNQVPLNEKSDLLPINDYGLSKLIQTEVAKYYGSVKKVPVCMARTFNVIGRNLPTSSSIGSFVDQIKNQSHGDVVKTGYLGSRRDYLDVEDICSAFVTIILEGVSGEIYNVCSGQPVSMESILDKLIIFSKKKLLIESQKEALATDISISVGDNSKLLGIGWVIRNDIDTALQKIII